MQPVGYLFTYITEDLNSGRTRSKSSKWSERAVLEPRGPPGREFVAPTTRSRCLLRLSLFTRGIEGVLIIAVPNLSLSCIYSNQICLIFSYISTGAFVVRVKALSNDFNTELT